MLVEFTRYQEPRQSDDLGEDDATSFGGPAEEKKISFNPQFVAAVFDSGNVPNVSIVKLADGRGFVVKGNYAETMEKLQAAGGAEHSRASH